MREEHTALSDGKTDVFKENKTRTSKVGAISKAQKALKKWIDQCEDCSLKKKPGTAQVDAISKAQKQQKDFKLSKYSLLRYRKNPKVEPNWRTRGDTLRFFIHSVANHQKTLKEGHFW